MQTYQFDTSKRSGLYHARSFYFEYRDLKKTSERYLDWVNLEQFLMLRKKGTNEYVFKKAAKRGNDYYRKRTWKRYVKLYNLKDSMPPKKDRSYSSFAFATFTYANRDIDDVMKKVSSDWNRYIAGMRKRYGKISSIRCYECQSDGVIHIHAILVFHEMKFKTFLHGKKRRFEKKDELSELWEWGFTDFFALNSWSHSLNYLAKYFMKDLELKTQREIDSITLLWIYKKRTYSISRRLENHCVTKTKKSGEWELVAIGISKHDLTKVEVRHLWECDDGYVIFPS